MSGVHSVYLAIWNASETIDVEPVILEMSYDSGEYSTNTTMSNDPNGMVFAIIVFDEAGNIDYYAGISEEGEVIIQSGSVPELSTITFIPFIGILTTTVTVYKRKQKVE